MGSATDKLVCRRSARSPAHYLISIPDAGRKPGTRHKALMELQRSYSRARGCRSASRPSEPHELYGVGWSMAEPSQAENAEHLPACRTSAGARSASHAPGLRAAPVRGRGARDGPRRVAGGRRCIVERVIASSSSAPPRRMKTLVSNSVSSSHRAGHPPRGARRRTPGCWRPHLRSPCLRAGCFSSIRRQKDFGYESF